MSQIIFPNLYITSAASGAPADIVFSPNANFQSQPPHMGLERATLRLTRGFDCTTLSPIASCGVYDMILVRKS